MIPKEARIILLILGSCYFFSFGLFSAKMVHQYNKHQQLKTNLEYLNKLSQNRKQLLNQIIEELNKNPEYSAVAKHLLAIQQITPSYTLENALVKIQEDKNLQNFTKNFFTELNFYSPTVTSSFLSQDLIKNEIDIELKQFDVISGLTID